MRVAVTSVEELEQLIDRLTPFGTTSTSITLPRHYDSEHAHRLGIRIEVELPLEIWTARDWVPPTLAVGKRKQRNRLYSSWQTPRSYP
jgi:hypothetical protein